MWHDTPLAISIYKKRENISIKKYFKLKLSKKQKCQKKIGSQKRVIQYGASAAINIVAGLSKLHARMP